MRRMGVFLLVVPLVCGLFALGASGTVPATCFTFPNLTGNPGDQVVMGLQVSNANAILAIEALVTYPQDELEALSVAKTDFSSDLTLVKNLSTPGQIFIAMAGAKEVSGNGDLFRITFKVKGKRGQTATVQLASMTVNDISNTCITNGSIQMPPYIIVASAGPHGSISPSGSVPVVEGTDQGFTITPDLGYRPADVVVDASSVGAVASYAFTNVTADHAISASFEVDRQIVLVSPKGGENWRAGSTQIISWTFSGDPGPNVKIELLKAGSVVTSIAANVAIGSGGSGSYSWSISPSWSTGSDYQVRITSTTFSSCVATGNSFTITKPTVTVTSPNSGESWVAGTTQTITWAYTGNPGAYVRIDLLRGGAVVATLSNKTAIGSKGMGSYSWIIPSTQTPGKNFKIRVRSTSNSSYTDTSDSSFTIVEPKIAVIAPNGGEVWQAGKQYTVSWSFTGDPGPLVKIELLKGSSASIIKSSTSTGTNGKGSYSWTIPTKQAPRSDYKIRITSTSNSSWKDASNSSFTIKSASSAQSSAGPDQKVEPMDTVKLSGSNSIGAGGGAVSYQWTQIDGPPVKLSHPTAVETTFEAPEVDAEGKSIAFQLTVTDQNGLQSQDSCIVNVAQDNAPPIADAGPHQTVIDASVVQLDGSRSTDPDDGIAAYAWKQLSGVPVALSDPSAMQPTFVALNTGMAGESLVFELTVTDQGGLRSRDTCIVSVSSMNRPPLAHAGRNQTVRSAAEVTLDGSNSTDDDDGIASYRWTQTAGSPVELSDPTAIQPAFTAPETGFEDEVLVFELTVTNAAGLQEKDKVTIIVEGSP